MSREAGAWGVILAVGAASLLMRASFLVLLRGRALPPAFASALGLVPAAVLSGLVVPDLLTRQGHLEPLGPRAVAGLIAALVAWRTRNVLWTLVVGLGLLAAFQAAGWR